MENLKEDLSSGFDLLTSLPSEVNVIIGYLLLGAFIITILLSFVCDKKAKKKINNKIDRDSFDHTFGEIEAPLININNLVIDKHQMVDKIIINKTGVYLIFEDNKKKGILTGDIKDEFLFIKKEKIINPLNIKSSYIKKVSEHLNLNEDWIKIIIKYPKIKKIEVETKLIIKEENEIDFESENLIEEQHLYDLAERFDRLKK